MDSYRLNSSKRRRNGFTKIWESTTCISARTLPRIVLPYHTGCCSFRTKISQSSRETADAIVNHIHSLYAAKVAAYARGDKRLEVRLDKEAADHAVYIDTSRPGVSTQEGPRYEQRIDEKYLNNSTNTNSYRVESFRSGSKLPEGQEQQIRCYFVYKCEFENANPLPGETKLEAIADKRFLQKATKNTIEIYQEIIKKAAERTGPVIEVFDIEGKRDKRAVVAYKQRSALGFFSALSDLVSTQSSPSLPTCPLANDLTSITITDSHQPGNTSVSTDCFFSRRQC